MPNKLPQITLPVSALVWAVIFGGLSGIVHELEELKRDSLTQATGEDRTLALIRAPRV
jgi:hypothetical protein